MEYTEISCRFNNKSTTINMDRLIQNVKDGTIRIKKSPIK